MPLIICQMPPEGLQLTGQSLQLELMQAKSLQMIAHPKANAHPSNARMNIAYEFRTQLPESFPHEVGNGVSTSQ